MGQQIIKQPDGLYAIFSNNVDGWIVYDATREELIEDAVKEATDKATEEVNKIVDALERDDARSIYHQFAMTFEEADAEHNERYPDEPIKLQSQEESDLNG